MRRQLGRAVWELSVINEKWMISLKTKQNLYGTCSMLGYFLPSASRFLPPVRFKGVSRPHCVSLLRRQDEAGFSADTSVFENLFWQTITGSLTISDYSCKHVEFISDLLHGALSVFYLNTKKPEDVNQLISIQLVPLIDRSYCLSFTSLLIHYCYWLLSGWNDIFSSAPLPMADYNYLQCDQESSRLEVVVSEGAILQYVLSRPWWSSRGSINRVRDEHSAPVSFLIESDVLCILRLNFTSP